MATSIQNLVPPFSCRRPSYTSPSIPIAIFPGGRSRNARKMLRICGAMVEKTVQGASSIFAKEMERLSAKESLLLAIENKVIISTKYSVEGPLRMKEEYVEGAFESPELNEEAVPEQLRGAFGQAFNTLQQLPVPIRDAVSSGMKVPLGGTFQRLILISYLDDEILIVRNTAGQPEVLTRLEAAPDPEKITEYES